MRKTLIGAISLLSTLSLCLGSTTVEAETAESGKVFKLIMAQNSQGDLVGENWEEFIVLKWPPQDGTTKYIVYRALSSADPWEELDRVDDALVRSSGGKVDVTPDARVTDLCYKVEAINEIGLLIRIYEAICVPKFVQE